MHFFKYQKGSPQWIKKKEKKKGRKTTRLLQKALYYIYLRCGGKIRLFREAGVVKQYSSWNLLTILPEVMEA